MDTFDRDDFVKVKGLPQIYQNRPQLTVHKIRRLEDHEVEPGDYFPCSKRDPEEMFTEFRGIISSLGNPHLRRLLEDIFADPGLARAVQARTGRKIDPPCLLRRTDRARLSSCALCRMTAATTRESMSICCWPRQFSTTSARLRN